MKDPATRLFLKYRKARDGAALARLFDLVAEDMLAVARHLAPDIASAEDLVQATFLVALERPESFDATREVKPWLYGVLARQAARARRTGRQRLAALGHPELLSVASEPGDKPIDAASEAECRRTVGAALRALPKPYDEVLTLHLSEELTSPEIAERLGARSAGQVRVQIGRGLKLLRERLPKSLAPSVVGAGVGLGASAPEPSQARGLEALRRELVDAATLGTPAPTSPLWPTTKAALLLAAPVAALAVILTVMQVPDIGAAEPISVQPTSAEHLADEGMLAVLGSTEGRLDAAAASIAPAIESEASLTVEPRPLETAVTGSMSVLVLDRDGVAIPGAVLRAELQTFPAAYVEFRSPRGAQRTAAAAEDGRATLTGLSPGVYGVAVTAQGFGRKGPFATPRIRGQETLAFQVQLSPESTVRGVIRDEGGRPIAGAKVFVPIYAGSDDGEGFRPHRTVSVDDGTFELGGLPRGQLTLCVTAPGCVALRESLDLVRGEVLDWHPVLRVPPEVRGVLIEEATGKPFAGWQVRGHFGALGMRSEADQREINRDEFARFSNWGCAALTDEQGAFVLRGLDAEEFVLSAQPLEGFSWTERRAVFRNERRSKRPLVLKVPARTETAIVRGQVAWDVAPRDPLALERLEATLRLESLGGIWRQDLDENGRFEFRVPSLPPGGSSLSLSILCGWDESNSLDATRAVLKPGQVLDLGPWPVSPPGSLTLEFDPDTDAAVIPTMQWFTRGLAGRAAETSTSMFTPEQVDEQFLLPGRYELGLFVSMGYYAERVEFEILPGQRTVVRPQLRSSLRRIYEAVDEDGDRIMSDVTLKIVHLPTGLEIFNGRLPAGGECEVELEPMPLFIEAIAEDGRTVQLIHTPDLEAQLGMSLVFK